CDLGAEDDREQDARQQQQGAAEHQPEAPPGSALRVHRLRHAAKLAQAARGVTHLRKCRKVSPSPTTAVVPALVAGTQRPAIDESPTGGSWRSRLSGMQASYAFAARCRQWVPGTSLD